MSQVIVIGAGLAGLNAAKLLAGRGHDVRVLESAERVGGRVVTDRVDGFLCDRGFQLLNTAYPAARRTLNYRALDLHPYGRGVAVRTGDGVQVLADPTRHPRHARGLLAGPITRGDIAAAWRWLTDAKRSTAPTAQTLAAAGFSPALTRVIERFLQGVVLDPQLATRTAQVKRLAYYFAVGRPSVPAQGMAAISEQLAAPLAGRIDLGVHVAAVEEEAGGYVVRERGGKQRHADAVVLAAGPRPSARLLGHAEPEVAGCTTWWFAADRAPSDLPFLYLDIRDGARIANTAVVSNICPSYAPAGRHLIQVTAVGDHGLSDDDARAQAGAAYGADTSAWRLLIRHDVPDALPNILPGTRPLTSLRPGLVVAGDTGDGSIQGAFASGEAAARILGR